MGPGLGQKIGKARDPRALTDDIEEIAMFSGCAVGELAPRTRA